MTKQSRSALPKARSTRLVVRELDSETIIYDLKSHKATCLNAFSAQVWRLCDGNRTVYDITEALAPADPAEGAVALALKKLTQAGLLTGMIHGAHPADGAPTRRAVIHGALALAAAIPVVTTITVPTAAQIPSTECKLLQVGERCIVDSDCCSGTCGLPMQAGQKRCLPSVTPF